MKEWKCEYCDECFDKYYDVYRHLRICKKRPIEIIKRFNKACEEDYGSCTMCEYVAMLPDEYPCSMCLCNESGMRRDLE